METTFSLKASGGFLLKQRNNSYKIS